MNILVIGAAGMAGHVITTYLLENGHDVKTVSNKNLYNNQTTLLDVTNNEALKQYLGNNNFDVVINCVGLLVQESSANKPLAILLNSLLPHQLEKFYENTSTKIIQLSTDCVFSGNNAPYSELSWPDGKLFYDRTKALGELTNEKDLTFRMSIIGPDLHEHGTGLFNWFMAQEGQINGYTNAMWSGVTTIELAAAINKAIDQNLTGLYHLVPDQSISKYNLLTILNQVFSKNIDINKDDKPAPDKTLVRSRNDFDHTVPDMETMIKKMKEWVDNHSRLYPHYV